MGSLIAMGLGRFAFATSAHDGIFSWGCNDDGQLGVDCDKSVPSVSRIPWLTCGKDVKDESEAAVNMCLVPGKAKAIQHNQTPKLRAVHAIVLGSRHSVAVCGSGARGFHEVLAWGSNAHGEAGVGLHQREAPTCVHTMTYISPSLCVVARRFYNLFLYRILLEFELWR